jgi:hypothetical protein
LIRSSFHVSRTVILCAILFLSPSTCPRLSADTIETTVAPSPRSSAAASSLEILKEIDSWVITDEKKIAEFIESRDKKTTEFLEKSIFWDDAVRSLSELLGIDYVSEVKMDNLGAIYILMRITGESDALFRMDSPMAFPVQITPNLWSSENRAIGFFEVEPRGKYVLVGADRNGDEKFNVYMFDRSGEMKPILEDPLIEYTNVILDRSNSDRLFACWSDRKVQKAISYSFSLGQTTEIYTESENFAIEDAQGGKLLMSRWLSFSKSQLFLVDIATGKAGSSKS